VKKSVLNLFAVASGVAVGNLYLIQPLLGELTKDLHTTTAQNGWLVTAVQLGYAAGIALVLPLGDLVDRRKMAPITLAIAGTSLVAAGLAPNYLVLLCALACLGLSTISGQLLIPLTNELSDEASRGRNSATVVSGMILGILLARTASGGLTDLIGWHLSLVLFGAINLVLMALIRRAIPVLPARLKQNYFALLSGAPKLLIRNPRGYGLMLVSAVSMFIFSTVWTGITFFFTDAPYHWSSAQIGMWGLVGAAGAIGARVVGPLIDKGYARAVTIGAWLIAAVSLAIGSFAGNGLVYIVVMLVVMDFGAQGINVNNQTRLLTTFAEARSRINATYVTTNFIAAAIGSAVTSTLWPSLGWQGLMWLCCGLALVALAGWFAVGWRANLRSDGK
jgi:predicted MFS family arabinose efflux permease